MLRPSFFCWWPLSLAASSATGGQILQVLGVGSPTDASLLADLHGILLSRASQSLVPVCLSRAELTVVHSQALASVSMRLQQFSQYHFY